jgi:hypothetical protein
LEFRTSPLLGRHSTTWAKTHNFGYFIHTQYKAFLWLLSHSMIFPVHPGCSTYQNFIIFYRKAYTWLCKRRTLHYFFVLNKRTIYNMYLLVLIFFFNFSPDLVHPHDHLQIQVMIFKENWLKVLFGKRIGLQKED